jgi:hypothetical protein
MEIVAWLVMMVDVVKQMWLRDEKGVVPLVPAQS